LEETVVTNSSRFPLAWPVRLAALLIAVVGAACNDSGGGGGSSNSGLLWQSQAGSGATSTGQPVTWINPNTGLGGGPIGIIQIISSVDDATYARYNVSTKPPPFNQYVAYIYALEHPLSTDTGSITITSKESELLGHINGYRNMVMGNNVAVGPVPLGPSVVLPSFNKGTKAARAHCKHYTYFHGGQPMPAELGWNPHPYTPPANLFPGAPWVLQNGVSATTPHPRENAEGDHVIFTILGSQADQTNNPGMLTPLHSNMKPYNILANRGRLGKIGIDCAPVIGEFSYSGLQFDESITVRDQMVTDDGGLIVDFWPPPLYPVWSHICVGHWKGGAFTNYWDVLFVKNPNPAN
jgi:hypothetical protein